MKLWNRYIVAASLCLGLLSAAIAEPAPVLAEFTFREPGRNSYRVEKPAPPSAGPGLAAEGPPAPQRALKAWPENDPENPVEFGTRLVLQVEDPDLLPALLRGRNLKSSRRLERGTFILEAEDAWTAVREASQLAEQPGVIACYPVARRPAGLHGPYSARPRDPFFFQADRPNTEWQPYLENRTADGLRLGPDLNVRAAWPFSQGEEVTIAIADDGFELDHPDLTGPAEGAPHFNFHTESFNGSPAGLSANHGTAVAGLAGARGNNGIGIAGVAPQSSLASWVIFNSSDRLINEEQLMDMFQHENDRVAVQNHSWGKVGTALSQFSTLEDIGISNAVTRGRQGLGVVMVRSAGNSRESGGNVNDDAYPADPRVIAVAAARLDGRVARYSTAGAPVLVAAFSGDETFQSSPCLPSSPNLMTTDRQGTLGYNRASFDDDLGDYAFGVNGFSGTSASAPQISGLSALILAANPALTYRDVQHILVQSGRHFDLDDPDLRENGAGFLVSHNLGYGIPDAGMAVQLAMRWNNLPPQETIEFRSRRARNVPNQGLRVRVTGPDLPEELESILALPSLGAHPDDPTPFLPVFHVGTAEAPLPELVRGHGVLIQRGGNFFCEKLAQAEEAGAAFAIVYNNRDGDARMIMGATDFASVPAVFISQNDGEALRDYLEANPEARAQLHLEKVEYAFEVPDTLISEHVGVRISSTHSARGDLRITLVSPQGTRSVLQQLNHDRASGPRDWTYWSAQHFYESSAGTWRVEVSDQDQFGSGSITDVRLILTGIPIQDEDQDGLDDQWELAHFGTLDYGPKDDPDLDGFNNAREQILGMDPTQADSPLRLTISMWDPETVRISWPSSPHFTYEIRTGPEPSAPLTPVARVKGEFPVTEWLLPRDQLFHQFFRIQSIPELK